MTTPIATPATCAQKNLEGECMDKEIESLQNEILKGNEVDDETVLNELFGKADESSLEGEFSVEEVSASEFKKAGETQARTCKIIKTRRGKWIKKCLTSNEDQPIGDFFGKNVES